MTTQQDFTSTGLKIEGAWENDRNQNSMDMFKSVVRECFNVQDVICGHHIVYEAHDLRADGQVHHVIEEIPSADTLIFDHAVARKLWGETHYLNALARLAMEPSETRDALLGAMLSKRHLFDGMPESENSGFDRLAPLDALRHHVTGAIERGEKQPITEKLAPCGMAERKLAPDGKAICEMVHISHRELTGILKLDAIEKRFFDLCRKAKLQEPLPSLNVMSWVPWGINAASYYDQFHEKRVALSIDAIEQMPLNELAATMAHELGHIVVDDIKEPQTDSEEHKQREYAADAFAAKLTSTRDMIAALRTTMRVNARFVDITKQGTHPAFVDRIARLEAMEQHNV